MKSLERVLATITTPTDARGALTNLAGIYELRGADAHLPSAELEEAFRLAGVNKAASPIEQGLQILLRTMQVLASLHTMLEPPTGLEDDT